MGTQNIFNNLILTYATLVKKLNVADIQSLIPKQLEKVSCKRYIDIKYIADEHKVDEELSLQNNFKFIEKLKDV